MHTASVVVAHEHLHRRSGRGNHRERFHLMDLQEDGQSQNTSLFLSPCFSLCHPPSLTRDKPAWPQRPPPAPPRQAPRIVMHLRMPRTRRASLTHGGGRRSWGGTWKSVTSDWLAAIFVTRLNEACRAKVILTGAPWSSAVGDPGPDLGGATRCFPGSCGAIVRHAAFFPRGSRREETAETERDAGGIQPELRVPSHRTKTKNRCSEKRPTGPPGDQWSCPLSRLWGVANPIF